MNKTEKYLFIGLLVAVVLLCGSICGNVYQYYHFREVTQMMRTDTVIERDTIYSERVDTVPQVVDENTIGYVNISDIFLHDTHDMSKKDEKVDTSSVVNDGEFIRDSLPIVQKTYADSTYTAYVSGIKYGSYPSLDSLRIKERTIYQTITVTKELQRKQKRFHVGVIGGYGYGFQSKNVEPFIGLGATWSLF